MSDKPICKSRRDAVKVMLGAAAAIPVINLVGFGTARADAPANALDASTNELAKTFQYHADATQAPREATNKPSPTKNIAPAAQHCANCMFLNTAAEGSNADWAGCNMFPGALVTMTGWCTQWTEQA